MKVDEERQKVFDEFARARMPELLRFGHALTGNPHAAADLVQDALERTMLAWPRVEKQGDPEGYVRRIMVNRNISIWRRRRRETLVLDVPEDVCHGEHNFDAADFWIDETTLMAQARRTRPDPAQLERAAALIARAERPLLLVGGGIHISQAYDALQALAENFGIPVAHTMSGKGAIACTHPLSAGLFGRSVVTRV